MIETERLLLREYTIYRLKILKVRFLLCIFCMDLLTIIMDG